MQVQALPEAPPMARELESGPRPRRFTVAEYHRMAEVGILGERDRVELLDGELVTMSPIGRKHFSTVMRLYYRLIERTGHRAVVSVQNPLILDDHSGRAHGRRGPRAATFRALSRAS